MFSHDQFEWLVTVNLVICSRIFKAIGWFVKIILDVGDGHLSWKAYLHHRRIGSEAAILKIENQTLCSAFGRLSGMPPYLSCDNCDFGNSCFSISIKKFGSVANNSSILLSSAGQKSGNIFKCDNGDVERVAKPDKSSTLDRSIDVKTTLNDIKMSTLHLCYSTVKY